MILDSENCKVTAETCTKFADSISLLVEGKNHQIMIDLPVAEKYLSI
jgi:hypothetical protein